MNMEYGNNIDILSKIYGFNTISEICVEEIGYKVVNVKRKKGQEPDKDPLTPEKVRDEIATGPELKRSELTRCVEKAYKIVTAQIDKYYKDGLFASDKAYKKSKDKIEKIIDYTLKEFRKLKQCVQMGISVYSVQMYH